MDCPAPAVRRGVDVARRIHGADGEGMLSLLDLDAVSELHATKAVPSRLHSNVEPASLELNSIVALRFLVLCFGPLTIVVSGAAVSGAGVIEGALECRARLA